MLAADAAEAAARGFAEVETTVGVSRYAPLNALAILVGSQTGRPGVLTQCAVEERLNLRLAIQGLVTYAETLSVYGTERVFVDGDDTPWSSLGGVREGVGTLTVPEILRFEPRLAPIKCAVFPLVNKDGMPEKALELYRSLKPHFNVFYDDKGAVGRRYRRQDEIGTPWGVTIDHQSKEDRTVTLRDRDTLEQERIAIDDLPGEIARHYMDTMMG